jgi:hypothetical protein
MTSLQVFAFFVLPIAVVAMGAAIYFFEGRRVRGSKAEPDLFDDKNSVRTPGE